VVIAGVPVSKVPPVKANVLTLGNSELYHFTSIPASQLAVKITFVPAQILVGIGVSIGFKGV
jgi:hypothetical protein